MSKKQPKENTTYITTALGYPIDADVVIINGVEYRKTAKPDIKPKPETFFDIVRHRLGYSIDCCDEILDAVEEWLPDEFDPNGSVYEYEIGWNEAIQAIKEKLR